MAVVERVTRTVFNPCKGMAVKHQVVLGSKDQAQKRKGELSTYNYKSTKYSDVTELTSMIIESSDFLILEKYNKDKDVENEKIFMSYPHLFKMKRALKQALKWFYADEFEDLFIYKGNELIFNSDYTNEKIEIFNLVSNKAVMFQPDVIEIENQQYEGLIMFLNSESEIVQLTIDQVEALYDFFETFNLYQSSQLLINYVTSINPDNISTTGFSPSRKGNSSTGKMPLNKKKKKTKKKGEAESE
jgi:ribosomal protein L4